MADTPGAWRRIRRRLGLVRRGLAVAFGPDGGSAATAPAAPDPRLAGAPPGLAEYVAAHEPVWFEYDADDPRAGVPAGLEPMHPGRGERTTSPDALGSETVPRTPVPVASATRAAAGAAAAAEPAAGVEVPAADAPARPGEPATSGRDAPRRAAVERPVQRVGFRRPAPERSEPDGATLPPGPTADLAVTAERPVRAADLAPDLPAPRSTPPPRSERAAVPEHAPAASPISPEPVRSPRPLERPGPPPPEAHTVPSRPAQPVPPQQHWPTPGPAPREPVSGAREPRPAGRAPEAVGIVTHPGDRPGAPIRSAPWPDLPERASVDDDAAGLDRDIWGADALVEELRAR